MPWGRNVFNFYEDDVYRAEQTKEKMEGNKFTKVAAYLLWAVFLSYHMQADIML